MEGSAERAKSARAPRNTYWSYFFRLFLPMFDSILIYYSCFFFFLHLELRKYNFEAFCGCRQWETVVGRGHVCVFRWNVVYEEETKANQIKNNYVSESRFLVLITPCSCTKKSEKILQKSRIAAK